jgi:hypothetical protein
MDCLGPGGPDLAGGVGIRHVVHPTLCFRGSSHACFTDRATLTAGHADATTNTTTYAHAYVQPAVAYSAVGGLPVATFAHSYSHIFDPLTDPVRAASAPSADSHAATSTRGGRLL